MGTINYKTSDFITVGYNCNYIDYEEYEWNIETIQEYFDTIHAILTNNYNFYYFNVTIEPGYYEGFYIDIEHNYNYCYDNYLEKRAALKEITQIKKFLLQCINDFECCAVYPGWCTGYADYKSTLEELDAAINEMRRTVKSTPTWATLPDSETIPLF